MRQRIHRVRQAKNRREVMVGNPTVRSIIELLNYHFYIPRYQRGYRWEKQEITELLDDILLYHNTQKQSQPFYCLQSIVVRKKVWTTIDEQKINGWEVIDGQQRLITLLLLLNYLESIIPESMQEKLGDDLDFYNIDFETRANSRDYLQNKTYKLQIDDSNIDLYYISKAYQYIGEWFDNAKLNDVANAPDYILNTLLDTQQNVALIWYEYLSPFITRSRKAEDSSIDIFTRMNESRTQLSNAALVKALLLQSDIYPAGEKKFVNQQLSEIAGQWDQIEAKLQDETMWHFITAPSNSPASRIELLFEMLAEKWNEYDKQTLVKYDVDKGKHKHFVYQVFEQHLQQVRIAFSNNLSDQSHALDPINDIWTEVMNLFSTLEEWYNHHTLYHYIGYLFTVNSSRKGALLNELIALKIDKDLFLNHVMQKIAQEIKLNKNIDDLKYGEDNKAIVKLLLLMDIDTLVKHPKKQTRFPFHLYKKDKIDRLAHINPQTLPAPETNEASATNWLQHHQLALQAIKKEIPNRDKVNVDNLLPQFDSLLHNFDKEEFEELFAQTIALNNKLAGMKESEKHALCNLALVDKETNCQLNNSFFDVKRHLLQETLHRKYIPIHTLRVFTKYYSESPQEMIFWTAADKEKYMAAIKGIYDSYTQLLKQHHDN